MVVFIDKFKEHFMFSKFNRRTAAGLRILITGLVLVIVCYNFFFVYVQPDEFGIKVIRVGPNRGVQKEVYHAGLTFVLPFGLQ